MRNPDDKRNVRSIRLHDSTWEMLEGFAKTERSTATTLITDSVEAAVFDFVRCFRCHEAVPVKFGDLDGRPLREWIAAAQKAVVSQKCVQGKTGGGKTSAHTPVTVGVQRRSQSPSASGTAGQAAMREEGAQGRMEPREAVPAQARKATPLYHPAPKHLPVQRYGENANAVAHETDADWYANGGVPVAVFAPGLESGPEDCLHPRVRVKGTCPDCHEWVGSKR